MTSLLEPVMIGFLGIVVGTIVIEMYLPIIDIAGGIDAEQHDNGLASAQ